MLKTIFSILYTRKLFRAPELLFKTYNTNISLIRLSKTLVFVVCLNSDDFK